MCNCPSKNVASGGFDFAAIGFESGYWWVNDLTATSLELGESSPFMIFYGRIIQVGELLQFALFIKLSSGERRERLEAMGIYIPY